MAIRHHWRWERATRTSAGRKLRTLAAGFTLTIAILLAGCGAATPTATPVPTPVTAAKPPPTATVATVATSVAAAQTTPTTATMPMHDPMVAVATRPATLDLATTQRSAQGMFRVTRTTRPDPIVVNEMHTWTIHVETASGALVEGATIGVDGDMPEHGHGLPTSPAVTKYLGKGDYLVEGMMFQMPGWWVVEFDIAAGGQTDRVAFNLLLE
jgi:YtkA-like